MKSFFTLSDTSVKRSAFFASLKQKSLKYCNTLMKNVFCSPIYILTYIQSVLYVKAFALIGSNPESQETIPASIGTIPASIAIMPAAMGTIPASIGMIPVNTGKLPALKRTLPALIGTIKIATGKLLAALGTLPASIGTIPTYSGMTKLDSGKLNLDPGTTPSYNAGRILTDMCKLQYQKCILSILSIIIRNRGEVYNE